MLDMAEAHVLGTGVRPFGSGRSEEVGEALSWYRAYVYHVIDAHLSEC